jgi:septum formation protein
MPIVLASASPRRRELLQEAGVDFVVKPANIPELRLAGENARAFAERIAREKALTVLADSAAEPQYVLGADTVVVLGDLVLGKPENQQHAATMLRLLSGRHHQVITGVCLMGANFEDVRSETTTVYISALSDREIRAYIATGEPMDKAGAYAIQGFASRWIQKIEGDYSNVVGLPVELVLRMMREHGVILD